MYFFYCSCCCRFTGNTAGLCLEINKHPCVRAFRKRRPVSGTIEINKSPSTYVVIFSDNLTIHVKRLRCMTIQLPYRMQAMFLYNFSIVTIKMINEFPDIKNTRTTPITLLSVVNKQIIQLSSDS